MKLLIAVPCMDMIHSVFMEMYETLEMPPETCLRMWRGSLVHDARNMLCTVAFDGGFDYVMWIDSDMILPQNAITRLLNVAQSENVGMVTGLYVQRTYPTKPVIYDQLDMPGPNADGRLVKRIHEYMDYPANSVFPVAGCGFGCVLTSVPLLRKVWEAYPPAFTPLPWGGEDIAFCYRVRQLGEKILCDSSVSCGHIGTFVYTEHMLKRGEAGEKH